MPRKKQDEIQRFNSLLTKQGDCLLFPYLGRNGYGVHKVTISTGVRKSVAAHRWAWTLANGPIKKGMSVCHHCDNRACCSLNCLFLATPKQNSEDMIAKKRSSSFHSRKPKVPMSKREQRAVLSCRDKGQTIYHIAQLLGRDYQTVKSWLHTREKQAAKQQDKIATMLRPKPITSSIVELPLAA
jgi:hypothetical protein